MVPKKRRQVTNTQNPAPQTKKKSKRKTGIGSAILAILLPVIVILVAPILSFEFSEWGIVAFMPPLVFLAVSVSLALYASLRRLKLWLIHLASAGVMFLFGTGFVIPGPPNIDPPELRVLTLNCLGGASDVDKLVEFIRKENVHAVFLQESRLLHGDFSEQIKSRLPDWDIEFESETAIASRFPITEVKKIPTRWVYPRHVISAKISAPSGNFRLISTHLTIPVFRGSPLTILDRLKDEHDNRRNAYEIGIKEALSYDYPVIYAGDFNTPPLHGIYGKIEERLDNAFVKAGAGWGFTFRHDIPLTRIDHIWVNKELDVTSAKVVDGFGSDHLGLMAGVRRKKSIVGQ